MAGTVKFRFSDEQLRGEVSPGDAAPTEGMLDNGGWGATEARQDDMKWVPDLQYSVINAFADTWACFCCGRWSRLGCTRPGTIFGCTLYRMSYTRAQWIWAFNLVCLVVHSVFAWLAFNSCNTTRFGQRVNENCTAAGMQIAVSRFLIEWNSTSANGYNVALVDNGMPVRIDFLTGWFFLLSAIFHAFAVLAGPFDRLAPYYWKQLDNALAYWRWIEYSASASVMTLSLFLISGIREQNNLAMAFILMATTQMFGLLTEIGSRPDKRESDGYRGWVGDPVRSDQIVSLQRKELAYRNRNYVNREEGPRNYSYTQTMAKQDALTRYNWENQRLNDQPPPLTYEEKKVLGEYRMAYRRSFVKRMIPHALGIIPVSFVPKRPPLKHPALSPINILTFTLMCAPRKYVTVWIVFLNGFFQQLNDLKQGDDDLFAQVPGWVPVAIVGTVIIFSSFTLVQIRYQWSSPDNYWMTGTSPAYLPPLPHATTHTPAPCSQKSGTAFFRSQRSCFSAASFWSTCWRLRASKRHLPTPLRCVRSRRHRPRRRPANCSVVVRVIV